MSDNTLVLEGVMTIAQAEGFHHTLEELFRKAEDVQVVTTHLERVDTSILQSLVGFVRDLNDSGAKVSWGEPSEIFLESVKRLGLSQVLDLA